MRKLVNISLEVGNPRYQQWKVVDLGVLVEERDNPAEAMEVLRLRVKEECFKNLEGTQLSVKSACLSCLVGADVPEKETCVEGIELPVFEKGGKRIEQKEYDEYLLDKFKKANEANSEIIGRAVEEFFKKEVLVKVSK